MKEEPKPRRKYRKYDASFKSEAIRQMESGRSVRDLAASLGVSEGLLHRWKKVSKTGSSAVSSETRQLRKEMKQLREENEILKKALSIFSRPD